MAITFLNADLEIHAEEPLEVLSDALAIHGHRIFELHCGKGEGGFLARYEVHPDPEESSSASSHGEVSAERKIHEFCEILESLPVEARQVFTSAKRRVIDLGYQGDDFCPPLNNSLSVLALSRMTALGIELVITVYPPTISHP